MTAEERGKEMLRMKIKDIPPLAIEHLTYLSNKIGTCLEVILTVLTVYAQIVEGLVCTDEQYLPDHDAISWYTGKGFLYRDKCHRLS